MNDLDGKQYIEEQDMAEKIKRIKEVAVDYKEEFSPDFQRPAGFIEGFALTGDFVKALPNKKFKIVEQPFYEKQKKYGSEEFVNKLVLIVDLNGQKVKYYPNKTSQRTLVKKKGYFLPAWIDFEGEFFIENQLIGNIKKDVIYIAE